MATMDAPGHRNCHLPVVTPGMFGGFVIARLAIGSWLLLLAALGWSLYVESRRFTPALPPRLATSLGRPTT
jgi:hypothetical protein